MHAVRLYPAYHQYRFDLPELAALLEDATRRHLIVQISLDLEDPRVHHPALNLAPIDITPLAGTLRRVPAARVQLLNGLTALQQGGTRELLAETAVRFDIANLEGTGAIGRLIAGKHWSLKAQVPLARLLFGSHAPFFPFEAALLRLFESPLTRDEMLALMSGNATTWQEQRGS